MKNLTTIFVFLFLNSALAITCKLLPVPVGIEESLKKQNLEVTHTLSLGSGDLIVGANLINASRLYFSYRKAALLIFGQHQGRRTSQVVMEPTKFLHPSGGQHWQINFLTPAPEFNGFIVAGMSGNTLGGTSEHHGFAFVFTQDSQGEYRISRWTQSVNALHDPAELKGIHWVRVNF